MPAFSALLPPPLWLLLLLSAVAADLLVRECSEADDAAADDDLVESPVAVDEEDLALDAAGTADDEAAAVSFSLLLRDVVAAEFEEPADADLLADALRWLD